MPTWSTDEALSMLAWKALTAAPFSFTETPAPSGSRCGSPITLAMRARMALSRMPEFFTAITRMMYLKITAAMSFTPVWWSASMWEAFRLSSTIITIARTVRATGITA